jgi:hypothetical protein
MGVYYSRYSFLNGLFDLCVVGNMYFRKVDPSAITPIYSSTAGADFRTLLLFVNTTLATVRFAEAIAPTSRALVAFSTVLHCLEVPTFTALYKRNVSPTDPKRNDARFLMGLIYTNAFIHVYYCSKLFQRERYRHGSAAWQPDSPYRKGNRPPTERSYSSEN